LKPRKKARKPKVAPEAQLLQEIIAAMLEGYGPGGLTALASALKLTPSNLRKRMASPRGAFNSATIFAYLAAVKWKAENFTDLPIRTAIVGRFEIAVQNTEHGQIPTWREIA
jgi:hypothetical protein